MNLKSSTLTAMMEALKELGFSALSILETGEALCEFLKPFLDEDGFVYDEAELLTVCTNISNLITKGPLIMLILLYLGAGDNFSRMISMHYPEVNYPLLNAYAVR